MPVSPQHLLVPFLGIVAVYIHCLKPCNNETSPAVNNMLDVRLPDAIKPISYHVKLLPFLQPGNFTFAGEESITFNVTQPTSNITLHVLDLAIREDTVSVHPCMDQRKIPIRQHLYIKKSQFYVVALNERLMCGHKYQMNISFAGKLNDDMHGFYRSSYMENGEERWMAVTQFEPTDARKAFPCFDEPSMKATFAVTLARPRSYIAASNMPAIGSPTTVAGMEDHVWESFQETVPMSTYLLAFLVAPFERKSSGAFSIWARKEALPAVGYSLGIGPRILDFYEAFFRVPFPLPKMDLVAVPDFSAGAMENWGLTTYREASLLYDKRSSTVKDQFRVASTVAHELAHQWFGNLVTLSWWNDLWLNEGFASFMEYLGTDAVEPTWSMDEQFVLNEAQEVLLMDSLETTHPISVPVHDPDEINEIFDDISYAKGASIIRMMQHFLTPRVFQRGLSAYLRSKSYSSATADDLWKALTKAAHDEGVLRRNESVGEIMATWTLQEGYPVVTVLVNPTTNRTTAIQERFFYDAASNSTLHTWWVPLSYTTETDMDFDDTKPKAWMRNERKVDLGYIERPDRWAIFNIRETGYYRVNYDCSNWRLLMAHLNSERFQAIGRTNRAQIVDDALNLARAGLLDYGTALDITHYLKRELHYVPWASALSGFSYLRNLLERTPAFHSFKEYLSTLLKGAFDHLGLEEREGDDHLTQMSRRLVAAWACQLGMPECVGEALGAFHNWYQDSGARQMHNPIPPNLRHTIYCTALKHDGYKYWHFLWTRYRHIRVGGEKTLLLSALGCSRNVTLLRRYLRMSLDPKSGIRKQDAQRVFVSVASNPVGMKEATDFLLENFQVVEDNGHGRVAKTLRLTRGVGSAESSHGRPKKEYSQQSMVDRYGGTAALAGCIVAVANKMSTREEVDALKAFGSSHQSALGRAKRALANAIETAEANVDWLDRNYHSVTDWMHKYREAPRCRPGGACPCEVKMRRAGR